MTLISKSRALLVLITLICFSTPLVAQNGSEPIRFAILERGIEIGEVDLSITDGEGESLVIDSEMSFSRDDQGFVYSTVLELESITDPILYRMTRVEDGSSDTLRCRLNRESIQVTFDPGNAPARQLTVEKPDEEWMIFDTNSLIGLYLFSLNADPDMGIKRGNVFLLPTLNFASYEFRHTGPTVYSLGDRSVQCDSYSLKIDGRFTYTLYIYNGELISVNQQGQEIIIRLMQ